MISDFDFRNYRTRIFLKNGTTFSKTELPLKNFRASRENRRNITQYFLGPFFIYDLVFCNSAEKILGFCKKNGEVPFFQIVRHVFMYGSVFSRLDF